MNHAEALTVAQKELHDFWQSSIGVRGKMMPDGWAAAVVKAYLVALDSDGGLLDAFTD